MDFRPVNFKLPLCAGFLLAAVSCAVAQPDSGQAIIFSKPLDHSATPDAPDTRQIPGGQNPSGQPLFFTPPEDPSQQLPLPKPQLSADEQKRLQKNAQDKKDWTLLTPEEILGVATPESILQSADAQREKLTPMERFMNRQEEARHHASGTNGYFGANDDPARWNPFQKKDDSPDDARVDSLRASAANNPASPYWKQLFNNAPDNNNPAAEQDNAVGWAKPFGPAGALVAAAAANQAKLDQEASMARFREMMSPGSAPADKAAGASPGGKFLYSTETLPAANAQPVNGGFNAVTPLSTVNSKPAGLTPLTGVSGQVSKPATVTRPSWMPQPPPWLSQTPQPTFVAPQREF